jgi:transcriptional regulator with XRE-family HTH domain
MMAASPTVRRKRLGIELRRLREQARLTCEEVGQRLDCSGTRMSRVETGRISVRPGDARELLEIYGVTGTEADSLIQLAREARRKGWWHTYGGRCHLVRALHRAGVRGRPAA